MGVDKKRTSTMESDSPAGANKTTNRDLVLIVGGRLTTVLLGLVSLRIVTTLLSPEQYGSLSLLIAVQMFCSMFLINPVEQHIYRQAHAWWDSQTLLARLRSYKVYTWIVSGVGSVFIVATGFPQSLDESLLIGLVMLLMVVSVTWNGITVPMLNMLGFRGESVLWSVLTMVLSVLFSVMLVFWSHTAIAWFAGQAIGMALGALGAGISLRRKSLAVEQSLESLALIDKATVMTYCLPLAGAMGLMWLQLSGYRFVIEYYWGLEALGYIAVGFLLTSQVWGIFEYLATQFFYPGFYRHITGADAKKSEATLSDLLNILGPMSLVLAGVNILAAPSLLYVLVDQQYQSAIIFIYFGVIIECCRVLGNFFSRAAHITCRTNTLILPYAIGALVQLLLLFIAGRAQVDVVWIGLSLVVGALLMLLIMATKMFQEVHFRLDMRRWLLAFGILIFYVLIEAWLPHVAKIWQALCVLAVAGLSGVWLMYLLSWRSSATKRILEVDLRVEAN